MAHTKTTPVITLTSLTKRYGVGDAEQTVLDGVDLTIHKGEFIAIMGPSGCGKTTLLNILGLLDRADEGTYKLNGKSVTTLSSARCAAIRSEKIGFVFQSFNLVPRLNVVENVALPLTYTGCGRTKSLKRASEILSTFHLNEREYYMPWQLSGGQTQRVAIARALVNKPSIILADEPTGNLDSKASHVIMEELSEIHKRGNTIIMVTHNPDMTTYADRVITMLDGKIDTDTQTTTYQPSKVAEAKPDEATHKEAQATHAKEEAQSPQETAPLAQSDSTDDTPPTEPTAAAKAADTKPTQTPTVKKVKKKLSLGSRQKASTTKSSSSNNSKATH